MPDSVRRHYELYPYPSYPLLASVRRWDTYALNLDTLWSRFNGELPPKAARRVLIAGCGSFSPYPFALGNPDTRITALDLSGRSLRRARWHCLLHGLGNVDYITGDLVDAGTAPGPFGLIDAFGVLHHLEDPLQGLTSLAGRLSEGGILRVMVYSRYTRAEEEAIRRALRMLNVNRPEEVVRLVKRSKGDSRLRRFFETSEEMTFRAGIADALLHPCVSTFRIDPFLEMISASGLKPLLFAHRGALPEVAPEVERIRDLEAQRESPGNYVVYLGRNVKGECAEGEEFFSLNPCLREAVSPLRLQPVRIAGRLGFPNPQLGRSERAFLSRFRHAVSAASLSPSELSQAIHYRELLFLQRHRRR